MVEANSLPGNMAETVRWAAKHRLLLTHMPRVLRAPALRCGPAGGAKSMLHSGHAAVAASTRPVAPRLRPPPLNGCSATVRASLFMLFNTALGSYIVGTITLLVVGRWSAGHVLSLPGLRVGAAAAAAAVCLGQPQPLRRAVGTSGLAARNARS